jgi:hypothetical protein
MTEFEQAVIERLDRIEKHNDERFAEIDRKICASDKPVQKRSQTGKWFRWNRNSERDVCKVSFVKENIGVATFLFETNADEFMHACDEAITALIAEYNGDEVKPRLTKKGPKQ